MKRKFTIGSLLVTLFTSLISSSLAESIEIDLEKLNLGQEISRSGQEIQIEGSDSGRPKNRAIFELEKPAITEESYALVGQVKYKDMAAGSYLEIWTHLPEKAGDSTITQSFFSRTVAPSGPMGELSGDSDWRDFRLPALVNDGSKRVPLKISFNAHFKDGNGTVELRNLSLINGLGDRPQAMAPRSPILFGFIMGFACAALLAGGIWFLAKQRQRQELRRIQAVDV